jgi:LPXTG-motif cell wall-anchored protein
MPVSVASWKAPSASGFPYKDQVFFKGHSATLNEGRHLLSVDKPECFFQVDLVHGLNPHPHGQRGPDYGDLFIAGAIGGNKKCEMPTTACESLAVTKLSRTNFRMTGHATIENGAGVRAYIFTITRNGKVVKTQDVRSNANTASFVYAQTTPGTYQVSLKLLTSEGDKTSPACNGSFVVKPPTPGKIEVCEISSGKIVEIDQNQMSDKYTTDLSKCIPETPATPQTPGALPNTGVGSVVAIFSGVTSLSSAAYYFISRRFA